MADAPKDDKKPSQHLVEWGRANLPTFEEKVNRLASGILNAGGKGKENIPNASLIYGIGSAGLFAVALYHLFTGSWFNGFLLFVLGAGMFGFALHFLQNPD